MSRELAYFPPKNAKWRWSPKALQHSPWVCPLASQMGARHWRPRVDLTVDLINGRYLWQVMVAGWDGTLSEQSGYEDTAEKAVEVAEYVGKRCYDDLFPEWVVIALKNDWRPPGKAVKQ